MISFGIEEEFMLLDRESLSPVGEGATALVSLARTASLAPFAAKEYLASQVEHSSPVFTDLDTARHQLLAFRRRLGEIAAERGLVAGSTGTPFLTTAPQDLAPGDRYARVTDEVRGVGSDHQINGLHIHVAVPSRDAGVEALNRVRAWIPTLLALAGNSPFWRAEDTGFSSWRSIHLRRWGTTGCPPVFADAADYDRRIAQLVGIAGTIDVQTIAWNARLSEQHPTLEFRVFDAQLSADDSVLFAALARALVATALDEAERGIAPLDTPPELLDAGLWHAGRDGFSGLLLDPRTNELTGGPAVVRALVEAIAPRLHETGDFGLVQDGIAARLGAGNGADRQRAAYRANGTRGIRTLLESTLVPQPVLGLA